MTAPYGFRSTPETLLPGEDDDKVTGQSVAEVSGQGRDEDVGSGPGLAIDLLFVL